MSRPKHLSAVETLSTHAYSYEFDQMLYILNRLNLQRGPEASAIQLQSHVHLNWPPSDIFRVIVSDHKQTPHQVHVNFLGLAGAQGPLPINITELVLKAIRQGDTAMASFLDIFNHRLLELLHSAHRKLNPLFDVQDPHKTIMGKTILALSGVAGPSLENRCAMPDRSLLCYGGLFWTNPRNAQGFKQILSHYFQQSVSSFALAGRWVNIEPTDQTRLGTAHNVLGSTAALGSRAWDEIYYTKGSIGPLSLSDYQEFLPTGSYYGPLRDLCSLYVQKRAKPVIQLKVKPDTVAPAQLNGTAQLGWTSWLSGQSTKKSDCQTQLILQTAS